jgi:hypothetical protein
MPAPHVNPCSEKNQPVKNRRKQRETERSEASRELQFSEGSAKPSWLTAPRIRRNTSQSASPPVRSA